MFPLASVTRNSHTNAHDEQGSDLDQPEQIYQSQAVWQSLLSSVMLLALQTMGKGGTSFTSTLAQFSQVSFLSDWMPTFQGRWKTGLKEQQSAVKISKSLFDTVLIFAQEPLSGS